MLRFRHFKVNLKARVGRTEEIFRRYLALRRMLLRHFSAEEPGVNAKTIGCVWTGEFDLNTLRVDGEIFESGKKKLRIQKYPETCGRGLTLLLKPQVMVRNA